MYRNQSKIYYVTLDNIYNNTNTNTTAFVLLSKSLVETYNKNQTTLFSELLNDLNNLKNSNSNYKFDVTSSTIVDLVNLINSLIITKNDILEQLRRCELDDLAEYKSRFTKLTEKTIEQNSGIKLVYLQYLLMYDISGTNGLFIDEYLLEAQKVLDENGGLLKHL